MEISNYVFMENVYVNEWFNKIAIQGTPQMVVNKEANSSSIVYSWILF